MNQAKNLQLPAALLLLIISINFFLLAATLAGLCYVLEIRPASAGFLQVAGIAALSSLWVTYRIRRMDEPVRSEFAKVVYAVGIGFSLVFALMAAIFFSNSTATTRWIDFVIISNGLFLMLCLTIKMNDTQYMID